MNTAKNHKMDCSGHARYVITGVAGRLLLFKGDFHRIDGTSGVTTKYLRLFWRRRVNP